MLEKIKSVLESRGFKIMPLGRAGSLLTFSKEYDTAVGIKNADFYIDEIESRYRISARYVSEGRNILYFSFSFDEINEIDINKYISECEKTINESYARKLYLLGVRN
jgi:hypothetical protein